MTSTAQTELLTAIVEATRERLAAAACSVAILDGSDLEFRVASGVGEREIVGVRIPVDRGIAGWVVASGQTVAIADTHSDARFDRDTAQRTGFLPTSILATPIEGDDGPIGVLEVLDRAAGPQDMQVVAAAARQVALVLQLVDAAPRVGRGAGRSQPRRTPGPAPPTARTRRRRPTPRCPAARSRRRARAVSERQRANHVAHRVPTARNEWTVTR